MLYFVNSLLDSQDNIIDQLKALKANKNNKEVQKYIKALIKTNLTPYCKYCIDKYYFEKDVEEVKPSIPKIRSIFKTEDRVEKLLNSKDNIIDQLKLLKENKKDEAVDKFVKEYLKFFANKYVVYCIKKYYYGLSVKEIKPTAKNLNIKLNKLTFNSLLRKQKNKLKKQERKINRQYKRSVNKVKVGDTIKMLEGPFEGLTGIVKNINKEKLVVIFKLFDIDTPCECEDRFVIKEVKNAKKN